MTRGIETNVTDSIGVSTLDIAGTLKTISDIEALCVERGEVYDFEHFLVLQFSDTGRNLISDQILMTNWPLELVETYDDLGLFQESPVIQMLKKTTSPVTWDMSEVNQAFSSEAALQVGEKFREAGIKHGLGFNVHAANMTIGAVVFSGQSKFDDMDAILELAQLSNGIFSKCIEIQAATRPLKVKLSKRERECLLWTSEGKSSYEIGMILGLSEHTINNYMARVCMKLGAVNRPHLVAEAFRQGILI